MRPLAPLLVALIVAAGIALAAALALGGDHAAAASEPVYFATLRGADALPPNDSAATGTFLARRNGDVIEYVLLVPQIERATAATVNIGPAGELGERVAFVFRPAEPAVEALSERSAMLDGEYDVVSSIDITSRLTPVDDCGFHCWGQLLGSVRGDLSGLLREFEAGNAYIVVLTKVYQDGELRGRIQRADPDDPRLAPLIAPDAEEAAPPATAAPIAARQGGSGVAAWGWALIGLGIAAAGGLALGLARARRS